jgi:hypothetical protein
MVERRARFVKDVVERHCDALELANPPLPVFRAAVPPADPLAVGSKWGRVTTIASGKKSSLQGGMIPGATLTRRPANFETFRMPARFVLHCCRPRAAAEGPQWSTTGSPAFDPMTWNLPLPVARRTAEVHVYQDPARSSRSGPVPDSRELKPLAGIFDGGCRLRTTRRGCCFHHRMES